MWSIGRSFDVHWKNKMFYISLKASDSGETAFPLFFFFHGRMLPFKKPQHVNVMSLPSAKYKMLNNVLIMPHVSRQTTRREEKIMNKEDFKRFPILSLNFNITLEHSCSRNWVYNSSGTIFFFIVNSSMVEIQRDSFCFQFRGFTMVISPFTQQRAAIAIISRWKT